MQIFNYLFWYICGALNILIYGIDQSGKHIFCYMYDILDKCCWLDIHYQIFGGVLVGYVMGWQTGMQLTN
jgi:hypothetical protein